MDSGKKIKYCIFIFFVILIFGMLAHVSDSRDESKIVNNTEEITTQEDILVDNQYANIVTTEDYILLTEDVVSEETEETTELITENTMGEENIISGYELPEDIENKLDKIIDDMTLEEKVGQMFFIKNDGRFNYTVLESYPVGGIILFSGDFVGETSESVREELSDFQKNSKIPLLIGVDEEGGSVIRLSKYSNLVDSQYQSPRSLYAQGGFDLIKTDTIDKSQVLLSYGINVNFAPVCDLSFNQSDFMYKRAFGENVEETCTYVDLVVSTMNDNNMGSVLKHFPGYGSNGDTHKTVIRDSRGYEQFEENDFLPFESGIKAGAQCILVSHNIVECMDSDWPASLSPKVNEILRYELGFDGVVITDDLMMRGVSEYVTLKEAAVQAVLAGNDMMLSTDYSIQYNAVLDAVKTGEITEERLDQSVKRILIWKYNLGLLDNSL